MTLLKKIRSYPFKLRLASILFRNWRFTRCGRKTIVGKPLKMSYGRVSLGDHVYIWKNCRMEGVADYAGESFNPAIVIGNGVSIQQNLHMTCAKSIAIGDNTAIAANVTITDIDHLYMDVHTAVERQPLRVVPVEIGSDSKLYNNVVILPGTRLGKHCIVGANSVVSGAYEDYSVIAGSPARLVKRYNAKSQKWEKI